MGKRKHHSTDDEALGDSEASAAASSSTSRNDFFLSPPLKWSKKETSWKDGNELNVGINGTSEHPTRSNGCIPETEVKKAIWLVRKPKNVPIEHLNGLRFSRKPKYCTQEFSVENDDKQLYTKFECKLARPTCSMLHATSEETTNQKPKMIPGDFIRGTAWIGEILPSESCSFSNAATSSELSFLTGIDEFHDPEIGKIKFQSIRRKPRLSLKRLKERLKPHGVPQINEEELGSEEELEEDIKPNIEMIRRKQKLKRE